MADIETFEADDTGSEVLGKLNSSLEALNNDKSEADSNETLTNKEIDAEDNTITNLTTDEFDTDAKTGADIKVVTGTEGDANEIMVWNSDGDAVSSNKSIEETLSSDSAKIPTSAAVNEAIQEALVAGEMFVKHSYTNGTALLVGNWPCVSLNSGQIASFSFRMPANFLAITEIHVVMIPDATETIQWDQSLSYSADGESYSAVSQSDNNRQLSVTADQVREVRIDDGTNFSNYLLTLTANDHVAIHISSDTTVLRIVGLKVKYTTE